MAEREERILFINFIKGEIPILDYMAFTNGLRGNNKEINRYLRDVEACDFVSSAFTWAVTKCGDYSWDIIDERWRRKLRKGFVNKNPIGNYKSIWQQR